MDRKLNSTNRLMDIETLLKNSSKKKGIYKKDSTMASIDRCIKVR